MLLWLFQISGDEIKTKLPTLREELEQVYRLAAAIVAQGTKFEKSNVADVYRVTISGLAGQTLSDEERTIAVKDVQNAVEKVGFEAPLKLLYFKVMLLSLVLQALE